MCMNIYIYIYVYIIYIYTYKIYIYIRYPNLPGFSFSHGSCAPKGTCSEGSFRDTVVESHQMPGGQSPAGRLSVFSRTGGGARLGVITRISTFHKMWYRGTRI